MHYLVLVLPALIAGYYLLSFILALAEKDYLRHDLIPGVPPPPTWKSAYWDGKLAEAAKLGLTSAGDYQTGPHSSAVKGFMRLYVSENQSALIAVVTARFAGFEIKKTLIRTRLSGQKVIETNDCASLSDPTGGMEKITLWEAALADLLATHEARLQTASEAIAPIRPEAAFALYEQIEVERGQRMVEQNLARWTDPSRSTIRRSIKGAFNTLRANKAQTEAIVAHERKRMAAEKLKKKQAR